MILFSYRTKKKSATPLLFFSYFFTNKVGKKQRLRHNAEQLDYQNKKKDLLSTLLMKRQQLVEFLIIDFITRTFKQNPQIPPQFIYSFSIFTIFLKQVSYIKK